MSKIDRPHFHHFTGIINGTDFTVQPIDRAQVDGSQIAMFSTVIEVTD